MATSSEGKRSEYQARWKKKQKDVDKLVNNHYNVYIEWGKAQSEYQKRWKKDQKDVDRQ